MTTTPQAGAATAAGRGPEPAEPGVIAHVMRRVANQTVAPHQAAVVRIAVAFTFLCHLLRELQYRHDLYGPDSPWGFDLASRLLAMDGAFSVLTWWDSDLWFEFVYFLGMAVTVALLLGWRTRVASVLFMIVVISLENRGTYVGNAGSNVLHLVSIYLVLIRCGSVWSLDARRRDRAARAAPGAGRPGWDVPGVVLWLLSGAALAAVTAGGQLESPVWRVVFWGLWAVYALWWLAERYAPGEPRTVLDLVGNLVHAAAMLVVACEVCLIYATAGWYKIQGSLWQDGTAIYYPLNLDTYNPWPELSSVLTGNEFLVFAITYATVFVQVGFVFALLNRRAKNILLVLLIAEHLGIAFLMGLPIFSMAMISADLVFLPTAFLLAVGTRARRAREWVLRRVGGRVGRPDGAEAGPGPAGPEDGAPHDGGAAGDGGDAGDGRGGGDAGNARGGGDAGNARGGEGAARSEGGAAARDAVAADRASP